VRNKTESSKEKNMTITYQNQIIGQNLIEILTKQLKNDIIIIFINQSFPNFP